MLVKKQVRTRYFPVTKKIVRCFVNPDLKIRYGENKLIFCKGYYSRQEYNKN